MMQDVIRPAKAFGDLLRKCLSNLKLHGKLYSLLLVVFNYSLKIEIHSLQEMDYEMLLENRGANQNWLFYMFVLLWTSVHLLRSPTLSHLIMFCLGLQEKEAAGSPNVVVDGMLNVHPNSPKHVN